MTDRPPKFETSIDRQSKRLNVQLGDRAILFAYDDTTLYEHGAAYAAFDHIFQSVDDKGTLYTRDALPDVWNAMVAMDFPRNVRPYPLLSDEAIMVGMWDAQLEADMERFSADGLDEEA